MEDSRIVELYWMRSESAIDEIATKYGRYCYSIANNILANAEDAQESVNDTYLGAWNSIPSHRPAILSSFLGKITRRISIKKWQEQHADDELSDCVYSERSIEKEMEVGPVFDYYKLYCHKTGRRVDI